MKVLAIKKLSQLKGHSAPIYTLGHSSEQNIVFSGGGDHILASWNTQTFEANKLAIKLNSGIYSVCLIQEKNLLLIGNALGGIHVIDLIEKKEVKLLQVHQAQVFHINYSVESQLICSCSHDGSIAFFQLDDLKLLKSQKLCSEKVRQSAFSPHQNLLAIACGDGSIRIFDSKNLQVTTKINAHELSCNCIAFHPDKNILLSGGRDAHLKIWDSNNYELLKSIPAHNFALYQIAFSPNHHFFATASRDKTIKIWDAETLNLLKRIDFAKYRGHTHSVNALLWQNQTNNLISAGDDKSLIIWEILKEN